MQPISQQISSAINFQNCLPEQPSFHELLEKIEKIYLGNLEKLQMIDEDFSFVYKENTLQIEQSENLTRDLIKIRITSSISTLKSFELCEKDKDCNFQAILMLYEREKSFATQLMNAIWIHDKTSEECIDKLMPEKIDFLLDQDRNKDGQLKPAKTALGNTALHLAAQSGISELLDKVKRKWKKFY